MEEQSEEHWWNTLEEQISVWQDLLVKDSGEWCLDINTTSLATFLQKLSYHIRKKVNPSSTLSTYPSLRSLLESLSSHPSVILHPLACPLLIQILLVLPVEVNNDQSIQIWSHNILRRMTIVHSAHENPDAWALTQFLRYTPKRHNEICIKTFSNHIADCLRAWKDMESRSRPIQIPSVNVEELKLQADENSVFGISRLDINTNQLKLHPVVTQCEPSWTGFSDMCISLFPLEEMSGLLQSLASVHPMVTPSTFTPRPIGLLSTHLNALKEELNEFLMMECSVLLGTSRHTDRRLDDIASLMTSYPHITRTVISYLDSIAKWTKAYYVVSSILSQLGYSFISTYKSLPINSTPLPLYSYFPPWARHVVIALQMDLSDWPIEIELDQPNIANSLDKPIHFNQLDHIYGMQLAQIVRDLHKEFDRDNSQHLNGSIDKSSVTSIEATSRGCHWAVLNLFRQTWYKRLIIVVCYWLITSSDSNPRGRLVDSALQLLCLFTTPRAILKKDVDMIVITARWIHSSLSQLPNHKLSPCHLTIVMDILLAILQLYHVQKVKDGPMTSTYLCNVDQSSVPCSKELTHTLKALGEVIMNPIVFNHIGNDQRLLDEGHGEHQYLLRSRRSWYNYVRKRLLQCVFDWLDSDEKINTGLVECNTTLVFLLDMIVWLFNNTKQDINDSKVVIRNICSRLSEIPPFVLAYLKSH